MPDQANGFETGNIQLILRQPDGAIMAGASVAIYGAPFDPPVAYEMVRLAEGVADSQGKFSFRLDRNHPALDQLGVTPGDDSINGQVRALDANRSWLLSLDAVLRVGEPQLEELTANVDLSDVMPSLSTSSSSSSVEEDSVLDGLLEPGVTFRVCADGGRDPMDAIVEEDQGGTYTESEDEDPVCIPEEAVNALDAGVTVSGLRQVAVSNSDCSNPTLNEPCVLSKKMRRWVKIAQQHLARGMKGTFVFESTRETTTQTAVRFGDGNWQVGGWWEEEVKRGAGSVPGRPDGPYHRVRLARYRYWKWETWYCLTTPCYYPYVERRWRVHNWTGGLKRGTWNVDQPPRDTNHSEKLGAQFYTLFAKNVTFVLGVYVVGLELKSQTGYSGATRLVWDKIDGCTGTRWLYGDGRDPTDAHIVYARCE